MSSTFVGKQPSNLDEAIEILLEAIGPDRAKMECMTEREFGSAFHHGTGTQIRNSWCLWWSEDHGYDAWPREKPAIVKYFNDIDIFHADDMSGIIMNSLYRRMTGKDLNLSEQIEVYKKHWLEQGFKGGIYVNR